MPFAIFQIPVLHGEEAQAELNTFLESHRALRVERQFVSQGDTSFWTFCVDYSTTSRSVAARGSTLGRGGSAKAKIDYREILSPEDFQVFAKLRDVRKQLAAVEGIPVYVVFTNEQLAAIVQTKAKTKAELAKIEGLGDGKLDKSRHGSRRG